MELLPKPKHIQINKGEFALNIHTAVVLQNAAPQALLYAQMLQKAAKRCAGLTVKILRGEARQGDIALKINHQLKVGHYEITVEPETAVLQAADDEALCHGVQTLCQLLANTCTALPCMHIEDYPDLANRGYYLDCSRGRVPKLETLKRYADMLCRYKINQWQLYIEHTYLFRDLSEAWRDDTPLTAQEIMELDAYCSARHIELVPSLSSFGHMYKILSTKTHCDLCELEDAETVPFSYTYAGEHHTLNVSAERAVPFILSLIDEYRALFSSRKFNICADETFDLAKGRSAALAAKKGSQALYVNHVKALCEHLVKNGCTPMFWGDIMWRFPESCAELPPETICLNWGYLPNQREDEIRDIAKSGITQYACPGVCSWNCWMPMLENSYNNIKNMAAHAKKYNAIGLLNTDWGDYGHINDPRLSVPGILYGAAFAWNANPAPFDELNKAISFLEYGDASKTIIGAMAKMSLNEIFDWRHAVQWIEADDAGREKIFADVDMSKAQAASAAVSEALSEIKAAAAHMPQGKRRSVQLLSITAEAINIWNNIGLWISNGKEPQNGGALAVKLEHWFNLYKASWREVSKESGLANMTKLITNYADILRGRNVRESGADPVR